MPPTRRNFLIGKVLKIGRKLIADAWLLWHGTLAGHKTAGVHPHQLRQVGHAALGGVALFHSRYEAQALRAVHLARIWHAIEL